MIMWVFFMKRWFFIILCLGWFHVQMLLYYIKIMLYNMKMVLCSMKMMLQYLKIVLYSMKMKIYYVKILLYCMNIMLFYEDSVYYMMMGLFYVIFFIWLCFYVQVLFNVLCIGAIIYIKVLFCQGGHSEIHYFLTLGLTPIVYKFWK